MSKPLVLATFLLDGNEVYKKCIRAETMEEFQMKVKDACPDVATAKLKRSVVYDKVFDDYIDVEENYTPSDHDKFLLHFSTCRSSLAATDTEKHKPEGMLHQATGKIWVSHAPPTQSSTEDSLSYTDEELKVKSQIFGKRGAKLNRYQESINQEALLLARGNPALLANKGNLLEEARKAVHSSGYNYAHGNKTRSKKLVKRSSASEENTKKYSTQIAREERLAEVTEIIQSRKIQLEYIEKGKLKAEESSLFEQAATFEQQAGELKLNIRRLIIEKAEIQSKNKNLLRKRKNRQIKARKQVTGKMQALEKGTAPYEKEVPDNEAEEMPRRKSPTPMTHQHTTCICSEEKHGQMVQCDNQQCTIQWFHFGCVNLKRTPKRKWMCPICRPCK